MQEFAAAAERLLATQISAATALAAMLEQEYDILKSSQTSALEQLARSKQNEVDKIERANKEWQALLHQHRVAITLDDINRHLQETDAQHHTQLGAQFKALGDIARAVQQQNAVNGTVLAIRQETTHHLLSILYGYEPTGIYGPSGKKESGGGGHTIAEA